MIHASLPEFEASKESAVATLLSFLEGRIGAIEAARKLSSLRFSLVGDELEEDWRVFVGIDSETDHLPVGEERKNWSADSLVTKDAEIKRTEEHYRLEAFAAAHALLRRYEKKG
jgi:hypothetical protein